MATYNIVPRATTDLPNTGGKYFAYEDLKSIYKIILMPSGYEISDNSTALTENTWTNRFKASTDRFYPLSPVYEIEDQSEEPQYQEFTVRGKLQVSAGKLQGKFMLRAPKYWRNALSDFEDLNWRFAFVDEDGKILGTSPDDTVFKGLSGNMSVEHDNIFQPGDQNGDLVPIVISLTKINEWKTQGVILKPLDASSSFDPRDFDGLTDLDISVSSSSAASLTVSVKTTYSEDPIDGLVQADFSVLDAAGDAQSIDSVTDNSDGTYTIAASTSFVTGTVNLVSASSLSTGLFESTGAASFTIS